MIVRCPIEIKKDPFKWEVFLAGPIQGAPEWQNTLPDLSGITWISPRRESYENFSYEPQVDWETRMLRRANVVLFWIPPEAEHIEGRGYAQTTRTEIGEMLGRGKKVFIGVDPNFPGRRYFESKLRQYDPQARVYSSLEETLSSLLSYINAKKPGIYFTSDTHFSSSRALELSKRPFVDVPQMDWTMIERWNNKVVPGSKVFHLGDFGCEWALNELCGDIVRIEGNYERDGKDHTSTQLLSDYIYDDYYLCHEPLKAKEKWPKYFGLFGHIHGRQKIKKFGIDVGVDANNYTPMSLEDVIFFREAIEKGYYDDEVWC